MAGGETYNQIDLAGIYTSLWGYKALPFPDGESLSASSLNPYSGTTGTVKTYIDLFRKTKNAQGVYRLVSLAMKTSKMKDFYTLPVEVMVKVQAQQRIVKRYTHHQSNKGSIKEQWGMDDYDIDIRGILYTESQESDFTMNDRLQNAVQTLNECIAECMVDVNCELLEVFGIRRMAIEGMNFPFDRPGLHLIPFEIKAVSDFRENDILDKIL